MVKRILRDFSIYGLMPYIPKLSYFFVLPFITPFLTKFDYGVYGLVFSYFSFLGILQTLGLEVNLHNSFYKSREQYKWFWRQIYGFILTWSIPFAAIVTFVLSFAITEVPLHNKITIIILMVIPGLTVSAGKDIGICYCTLKRMPMPIMARSAIFGILNLGILYYLVKYQRMGYMGWFWGFAICACLENISWFLFVRKQKEFAPIFNFKRKTIIRSLKVSVPILPHVNALFILNQSDRIVMDWLKVSTAQIGLYSAGYSLSSAMATMTNAYITAVTPYFLQLLSEKKEKLIRIIVFASQAAFLLIAILFSLVCKEITEFLFRNKEFDDMTGIVVLLSLCSIFKPMYMMSTTPYSFYEKTKFFSVQSFIAAFVNLALNFILVPYGGIYAAAVSTIIGFMYLSFSRFYSKTFKQLVSLEYYPTFWILLGTGVCVFCYYVALQGLMLRMTILGLLLVAIILGTLFFKDKVIKMVKQ
ncbi:MAG: lipopolysaccharide biosynthesis protein [Chitinophagaceae bacterium]|nr:MAG: lipopolysaccharide biosynthesis protein [Chitinophagaceae bacterium]